MVSSGERKPRMPKKKRIGMENLIKRVKIPKEKKK